jgi:UMF1 family MFS transporter
MFDWANSAFSTVILTFVFSAYFTRQVAPDEIVGSQVWGTAIGVSGLLVAILGPILGATTDQTGRRKPWILCFVLLCVLATALLWFVYPAEAYLWRGALLAGLGALAIDLAIVFYNAMLPGLAGPERTGRWSGWGWGLGYAGGLSCLIIVLLFFVEEATRLAALEVGAAEHLRASFVFAAMWIAIFSLPLFLFTPDTSGTGKTLTQGIRDGLKQLVMSVREIRQYKHIVRFLIAHLFYVDGLATVFAFGGVYAAGTFDMDERTILLFAIALNISAGIGAFSFSWIDDLIGSRRTIIVALAGLIGPGFAMLIVSSPVNFWIAGLVLGFFVGPAQAASRSYLARIAPPRMRNEMFGLFAFSGKATAFAGPLLVGWITSLTGSQRLGMSTIIILFAIGFTLMLSTPATEPLGSKQTDGS